MSLVPPYGGSVTNLCRLRVVRFNVAGACVPRAPGVLENSSKIRSSEGTERPRFFFSGVWFPKFQFREGNQRCPYREWKKPRTRATFTVVQRRLFHPIFPCGSLWEQETVGVTMACPLLVALEQGTRRSSAAQYSLSVMPPFAGSITSLCRLRVVRLLVIGAALRWFSDESVPPSGGQVHCHWCRFTVVQ